MKQKFDRFFRLFSTFAEKRIFLVAFMILLGMWLVHTKTLAPNNKYYSPVTKDINLSFAKNKIKPGTGWKPKGWGSGEYLTDIPIIKAGAVINFDTGEVIWSMNLKQKIAPASLTKLATVMTALDIAPSDKLLSVSDDSAGQIPTKLGLKSGEKLTLEEAVSAAILTSANDAAETISDSLGKEVGSGTNDFMKLVNTKLQRIGANDSNFETSTGLDSNNHYSTVYDLAIIAHESKVSYPLISQVAATDYKRLVANSNHKLFDLPNWNALLGTYPGVDGLKIGYTESSGNSTIVTANREGEKLMAIVIGANSLDAREIAAATLLNLGFSHLGLAPYPVGQLDLVRRYEDWHKQLTLASP